jgi:hypothetical protein
MTQSDEKQHDEDSQTPADATEDERINDPLTRTEAKAPRTPFGPQRLAGKS